MSNDRDNRPGGGSGEFLITFGKAVLTLVLGIAALVALGLTVCGFLIPSGSGAPLVVGSLIATVLLVVAIVWLWR